MAGNVIDDESLINEVLEQPVIWNTRIKAHKDLRAVQNAWEAIAENLEIGAFTEDGMLKIWKGLYYYFWNLDKPLVQESMAATISTWIMKFHKPKYSFLFISAFFQTMAREWFSIDRYRLEKFMMFTRKFLNQCFQFLKHHNWDLKNIKQFRKCLSKTVTSVENEVCPLGLKLHVVDIYMDELAKVAAEELSPQQTKSFLVPYCKILANCENEILLEAVRKDIFWYLLNQDTDLDAFGEFPLLKFNPNSVQTLLKKHEGSCERKKNMKVITSIINKYEESMQVEQGDEEEEPIVRRKKRPLIKKRTIDKAAENLLKIDEEFSEEKMKWKKKKN